jgi:Domain of unknown function (DUF4410)
VLRSYRGAAFAAGLVAFGLAGCASTMPTPQYSRQIVAAARVAQPDHTQVAIDAPASVQILPDEERRLAGKIKVKIDARKVNNLRGGEARSYEIYLHVTRYDRGNAFARFMMAGLGQIHIEGKIDVYQLPARTLVGEFDLKKTFAWGAFYGAFTSMEDIENTFADGVAAAVTGQQAEPKQS